MEFFNNIAELKQKAEQGDAEAQYELGTIYGSGKIIPKCYAEAEKYYLLAAWQGYASAQFVLGGIYFLGEGVLQSKSESCIWFYLAEENYRKEAYKEIAARNRNFVIEEITDDEHLSAYYEVVSRRKRILANRAQWVQ